MNDRDNITLPRELVQLALDALDYGGFLKKQQAITALRAALASPRPEPVAYFDLQKQVFFWAKPTMIDVPMNVALKPLPLYTAPPAAAPEPVAKACWACNGKGCLRDIDTGGLLPCVVCKPQEDKQ